MNGTLTPNGLTLRQSEVLDFIAGFIRSHGYGPTVREIGADFEIRSPNGVHCHLLALAKKKMIRWEPRRMRSIALVSSAGRCPTCGRVVDGMTG